MRICLLILLLNPILPGQSFLGKVYNNIVVSNDSNEEDSLVASSAQTRQGDGGCGGGDGHGGAGGGSSCSGGRGKSGAGGPSSLGKDIVVTTNGPKAKIIVRKSKGSRKSVGTGSACSSCCSPASSAPPKVVYVPFCPHQMAASFPIPSYEPFPHSPVSYPSYPEQSSPARQSALFQSQSRSPPSPGHQSYEEPMMASSAQVSPQFHTSYHQLPPLPPLPPFSHHSRPSLNIQFQNPQLPPPPVSFQYMPNAGIYHSQPSFDRSASESIRHPSPSSSHLSTARMKSEAVNNNHLPFHSYSQSPYSSHSPPSSSSSQPHDHKKHTYPTSAAIPPKRGFQDEINDEIEFGRRTSPAYPSDDYYNDEDVPDDRVPEPKNSSANPFTSFIAKHGHPKLPR